MHSRKNETLTSFYARRKDATSRLANLWSLMRIVAVDEIEFENKKCLKAFDVAVQTKRTAALAIIDEEKDSRRTQPVPSTW